MHIVITGDSWANGAYDFPQCGQPTHPGFEYYLTQAGHTVTNLSIRGGSNELALLVLQNFLKKHPKPDLYIFWQCAFMRDCRDYFVGEDNCKPKIDKLLNLNLDWYQDTVEKIIEPHVKKTCEKVKKLGIKTIVIGGNTKFHPAIADYFDGLHKSATELVFDNFEDSFFSDRHDLELFTNTYLKKNTFVNYNERSIKYKFVDQEMNKFFKKYDAWHDPSASQFINMQHGTTALHFKICEKILELIG